MSRLIKDIVLYRLSVFITSYWHACKREQGEGKKVCLLVRVLQIWVIQDQRPQADRGSGDQLVAVRGAEVSQQHLLHDKE